MTLTTAALLARAHNERVDEDNPSARPRRRTFTAEYKHAFLGEYEALPAGGAERGALLRREGLYSSHLAEWRKTRDLALLRGLAPKVPGPSLSLPTPA